MLLLNKKLDLTVHTYVPTNEITKSQFIFIGIIKYAEGLVLGIEPHHGLVNHIKADLVYTAVVSQLVNTFIPCMKMNI